MQPTNLRATGSYSCVIGASTTDPFSLLLVANSLSYQGQLGQVKAVTFSLLDTTGVLHWDTGTQIVLYDDLGNIFWSGYLKTDTESIVGHGHPPILHQITTFNKDWLAAKRSYTVAYPANTLCGAIVLDVITNLLA